LNGPLKRRLAEILILFLTWKEGKEVVLDGKTPPVKNNIAIFFTCNYNFCKIRCIVSKI